jgi:hypothetical protein
MRDHLVSPDYSLSEAVIAKARRERSEAVAAFLAGGFRATRAAIGNFRLARDYSVTRGAATTFASMLVVLVMALMNVQSLLGDGAEDATTPASAMTGAALSSLHAAIPGEPEPEQASPTF